MIYLKSVQERDGDLIGGSWTVSTYMSSAWQMWMPRVNNRILVRLVQGVVGGDALAGWLNLIEEV